MTDEQLLTAIWDITSTPAAERERLAYVAAYERMEASMTASATYDDSTD